jgi:exopolysaccharide production protein ExoZ
MLHKKNTLDWIQLLRGVAAFLVVLTHARYTFLGTPDWGLAETIFRPGAAGVDLFFIISGFIMAYSTANSDGSFSYVLNYAIKRFARIWPAYAIVTVLWLVAAQQGFGYFHGHEHWRALLRSLLFLPVDTSKPLYFDMALPPGWTLAFEVYFYAVFGICLLFKRLRWFALAAWMALTIFILPLDKRGFNMDVMADPGFAFSYLNLTSNPIILEFLAGAIIGKLYMADWTRIRSSYVCWHLLGLAFAFAAWYVYAGVADFHGPVKWGWPIALFVLTLAIVSKTVDIRVPAPVLWLGTISYSLYLTHTVTQNVVSNQIIRWNITGNVHSWGHIFLTTACSLVVASIVHHYVEVRLSDALRNWLLRLAALRRKAALAEPAPLRSAA